MLIHLSGAAGSDGNCTCRVGNHRDQIRKVYFYDRGGCYLGFERLFEGAEATLIEAADPVTRDSKVAAHKFGSLYKAQSAVDLVNDA